MDKLTQLSAPFAPLDLEWRVGQTGVKGNNDRWARVFAYVDNRAILNRLDSVFGIDGWSNRIVQLDSIKGGQVDGFTARISCRFGEEWITKEDGADTTDFEALKGGISGAMKRAGSAWGIGRYLYDLPEGWALIHDKGVFYDSKNRFAWSPPAIPDEFVPEGYEFARMQSFIRDQYSEALANVVVRGPRQHMKFSQLMKDLKPRWGKDYYLTVYAFEALKKYV